MEHCQKLFHLDLKGAPPKPSYLKLLHPLLKKWGITGLLIEWEDCFPFSNELKILNSGTYTVDEASAILQDAKESGFELIPLVQTFGHLEFLLKHPDYVKYREVPLFPSSLCPSHPDSVKIVLSMVEQVLQFHVGTKTIHIGADEVWHMGLCQVCRQRIDEGFSKDDLFLTHVRNVVISIKSKWPLLSVIMWDDMLRGIDEATIKSYDLKSLIEPMVWHYNTPETFHLPVDIWSRYSVFSNIWVASAFKGATGGSQLLPVIAHHASNNLQWSTLVSRIKSNFKGIALTGWSRYDHFAALCELLPASIPSLGVCLKVLQDQSYTSGTVSAVDTDLGISQMSCQWNCSVSTLSTVERPSFPGCEIMWGISKLLQIRQSANVTLASEQLQTWMNEWQVSHETVNPMQLVTIIPVLNNVLDELNNIEKFLVIHLSVVFYHNTVEEFIGTYITLLKTKLMSTIQTAEAIMTKCSQFVEESLKNQNAIEMDC